LVNNMCRTRKGLIFTFEALLSLLFLFILVALIPLLSRPKSNTLEKFLFLSDAFEVIEKGYHNDFAFWAQDTSDISYKQNIIDAANKIADLKGLRFYIARSNGDTLPQTINCEKDTSVNRLIITSGGWKTVTFVLCK